ncbi:putative 3-hydroxyacyl-CoA dehydrogenase [Lentzea sp. NBRC 105346]|uniref:3-hydroxyacyl-CoA dehydrogenase family protein n=1 Tax=Lentzea sp. NBRC 105346 TaxID=3032205 RepID=UPI0024A44AC0|nr:3-hydroxyacyl-CoA dehydrogenase family protein [Lentzea sp. NBRC 105346]GLZ34448.1 putative 3-hydroxyacyl-CoA dehydrogenase [Lentzea sp. NBRC 105346]
MKAVVIGGGTMGAGIVHVLVAHGHEVTLREEPSRLEHALRNVRASLGKAEEKGKLASADEAFAHVRTGDLPQDAELVIEAVPEKVALKRTILGEAANACPNALLASNTSSLSIAEIAEGLPGERVLGMHFFNPVPVQQLVELVHHKGLDPANLAKARTIAEELGKTVIEVRDSPGFATSRLGVAVGMEAIRMLEEGVASAEDIDTGMTLGYRWPMGPLKLTDLVGLDVRLAIAEHLARELGPRFEPPQLLRDKVAKGELGQKSGQGFFAW